MKQVLHLCSKIRGLFSASQCSDVGYDCRLTVVRPSSDCRSTMLKLCSVLAVLLTVGVGGAWGVTFTASTDYGDVDDGSITKGGVTISGIGAAYSTDFRVYKSSTITISASSNITQIDFTFTKASEDGGGWNSRYTPNSTSWTSPTASGEQARLTQIVVTLASASVATPTFSVAAGTYTSVQSVTISCATAGSTIYYTTDGTTPTSSSTVYSSAVSISSSCTLKAIAKKGSDYSSVASASYTINIPYTVSFSTGTGNPSVTSITEDEYEAGIELPDGPTPACSDDGWVFAGWSETEYTVDNTTNVGRLRMPEDYFYPDDDVTLYAVYRKLTSGTSSATFTANSRSNLTQISSDTKRPAWWYHTSTGVEFYIKDYGYYSYYDVFDVDNSINNGDGWALFDAHRPITTITLTSLSGSPSVSLTSKEDVDGNSVSISSSTITCSGNVTQVLFDAPNNGEVTFSAFTVTYKNCKFLSSPTCASCDNDPTVTAASNNGSISSTSVPVQCASGISNIGGVGCSITSYGFVWAPSATTTTPTTSNSSHEVGTSYTVASTAFNYTITGLTPNTEYTIRPYATNGHGTAYGSAYTVTTLQRYAISYNNNGGSNSMDGAYKDHGVAFALPSTAGSMTKTGYHATGWLLGSSSGTHYDLSGSYTTNEAATFYVEWTANTYEVAFNNNGGSGSMSNESFTYDAASKALTTCTLTPPEHKYFTGWNTAPGGGGTSYTDGQSVQNLTSTNNGTVTLYAQWADHTYTNYTTTCCATKITMAKSITGNGTVTFGKTSVPTCDGGNTTMTITPDAGWTLSTFTPSGVSPSSTSPAVATDEPDEQEITVTFAADASGTYTATVVFVALHDKYFDRLHGNGESEEGGYHYYDKSGTGYSVPAPDEGDKKTGDDCTKEHYHFVGWLNADFLNSDGTPNTGAVGYEGPFSGGTKNATGATYYAIWSKDME